MFLEKITLTNFKNYAHQTLVLSPRLNAFVGLNGMGKTNFLDAIYYLCLCKSYFLTLDSDVILKMEAAETPQSEIANADLNDTTAENTTTDLQNAENTEGVYLLPKHATFMRLEGHFQRNGQREKVVAKVQPRKKKVFERNDAAYSALSDHIGFLPVVMIAPDDTELVREGSEERRRFLDNALSQLDNVYLRHLILYNRLLEQRNAALKKYGNDPTRATELDNLLTTYDHQLSPSAVYIFQKRQEFITEFEPIFNDFYQKIADNRESVRIVHKNGFGDAADDLDTEGVENRLRAVRDRDRLLQRTTLGVHRDDWVFEMGGKLLKKFGSQGQLKSFVIALKLAQFDILRGAQPENPILLLDDIFDKLDETRVQNLLQLILNQSFGQIFLTDTHPERIEKLFGALTTDSRRFMVENGRVEAWSL